MPSPHFTLSLTATPADIDELGHVSNQVYLRWVLEVAIAHSNAVGWRNGDYRDLGGMFVVRRHELDYHAPVLVGEVVCVTTWVDSSRAASCVRATVISRGDQIVLRAATTWVFTSIATGRPQRIPDRLLTAFQIA